MNRNLTLDITRTCAILLMVIFHFIYDLKFFSLIDWDTPDGNGWKHFRWVIITLFFLCLGISITFAHLGKFHSKKFIFRLGQIAGCALIISIATYVAIPQNWIFFGVLHFLAFASLMIIGFIRYPRLCLAIGCGFLAVGVLQLLPSRWPFYIWFDNLPRYTNDYVAIFPWLGMVFFGVAIAHTRWFQNDPLVTFSKRLSKRQRRLLLWPGQHSLSIYLLHQPIMLSILYVVLLLLR